jgi:putative heme-binding domain-containing protein
LLFKCKTGGEHDAHAVLRGPDGFFYLLCGNNARITAAHATLPTSPIKNPVAGCLLRFPPDFKGCEIVADGFRNAYGMDFNTAGELFTFDSDNERCVALPWYEHTRCYHVVPGGHHGWLSPNTAHTWRMPPYFVDVVAPIATLGRGSPTGVVCYKHTQFPRRYRGGLFLCDWTFGQVHFLPLERSGSSYIGKPEVFLRATGDEGFAPTAAAVHPVTGDLYISIGGRGTRGAVYRVRYTRGLAAVRPAVAALQPRPRSLDWKPGGTEPLLRQATGSDLHARRIALDLMWRHCTHFTTAQLEQAIRASAGQTDRGLRQAAARLLATVDEKEQERIAKLLVDPLERTTRGLARPALDVINLVTDPKVPAAVRLDCARLVQLALGGLTARAARGTVWEGYSRRTSEPELAAADRAALRDAFPSGDADLDRELTRLLALVEDDHAALPGKVLARITPRSDPIADVHTLIVLARLRGPRSAQVTRDCAGALLDLDRKLTARKQNRDSNWPLRIAELHAGLAARDPKLNAVLLAHPALGRPDHALFARCPGFDRPRAAEVFLKKAQADPDFAWNAELVGVVGALPAARALPLLRKLWGEVGLDDAILPVLARHARGQDHARFLTGLVSARLADVRLALGALEKLPPHPGTAGARDEALGLLRAIRQLPSGKEEEKLHKRLLARLNAVSGRTFASLADGAAWFRKAHPAEAKLLATADGVDVAGWEKRLAKIDWATGDTKRGQKVYTRASCASCHSGAQALGPDLRGVTGRFSRADLFTAIVQPSKDVAPRYRTTQLTTSGGQVYQGLIVYEAVDSVLLQTGPATTVRIAHKQIAERRVTLVSLMPTGLLDRLSDREISDLYAYLKSLGGGGKE